MAQLVFKRVEIKYLLDSDQHKRLLEEMLKEGRMTADPHGPSTVCNVYYDTPESLLIRRSMAHPKYKEKIRLRSYGVIGSHGTSFLELKKKCKGVVYKRRATLEHDDALAFIAGDRAPQGQIERELDFALRHYAGIAPYAFIAYDREAFCSATDYDFRMTFDRRVRIRWDRLTLDWSDEGTQLLDDGRLILEVKTSKAMPLWLVSFLSREGIFKTRYSKIATAYKARVAELGMPIPGYPLGKKAVPAAPSAVPGPSTDSVLLAPGILA